MPLRHTRLAETTERISEALRQVRDDLELPDDFPADVTEAAQRAVADISLPAADATHIPFVTIDPDGSRDLDQALHIEREGDGFVVWYAIADLPAVVVPGGAVDDEARKRGQTLYAPDGTIPLHPRVISEDAASLLPHVERGAYVFKLTLDAAGAVTATSLQLMRVRSRAQLTYREAQQRIDSGDPALGLLREVGELRIAQEAARDGASLDLPDEEIVLHNGHWRLERRAMLPVEQWNAQISLMTGMAAATLQLEAGAGILRTMPKPSEQDMEDFRRESTRLGVQWRPGEAYGAYLRRLDRTSPASLAILNAARRLFRGAGYLVLTGAEDPDQVIQAAIGAPYAHTTAPLRRLVDRYVLAHCEAIANDRAVPDWATAGLAGLAAIMQSSGSLAGKLERESLAVVTAAILEPHVGREFDGVVLEARDKSARVELVEPPAEVEADIVGAVAGTSVRVRLTAVDQLKRTTTFELA